MNNSVRIVPDVTITKLLEKVIETSDNLVIPTHSKVSKQQFLNQPIPLEDSCKDYSYQAGTLTGFRMKYLLAAKTLLKANYVRNCRYAYPESCLGWHTDSDFIGTRLYYTFTQSEAIFKYSLDGKTVRLDYDDVGKWTCRQFNICSDTLFWHSVWNKEVRYVFGFSL